MSSSVHAPQVLPDHTKEHQDRPRQERDDPDDGREADGRTSQKDLGKDGVEREERRPDHREEPDDGSEPERDDGKGENGIGGEPKQPRHAVLAVTCVPFRPLDIDANLPEANPAAKPAEVSMVLGHPPQLGDDTTGHQAEVAGIGWELNVGEPRQQAVEGVVTETEPPGFLAQDSLGVDDVVALRVQREELRNRFRPILQVAVHHDRRVACDVIERRRQRRLMAEVS